MRLKNKMHAAVTIGLPTGVRRPLQKEHVTLKPGEFHDFSDADGQWLIDHDKNGLCFELEGASLADLVEDSDKMLQDERTDDEEGAYDGDVPKRRRGRPRKVREA